MRNRLPLSEVHVGETGHKDETICYTIGPVECIGEG